MAELHKITSRPEDEAKRFELVRGVIYEMPGVSTLHKAIVYGTQAVWLVYPDKRVIDVYRPAAGGPLTLQKYTVEGVIEGSAPLPGFNLPVHDVFPATLG